MHIGNVVCISKSQLLQILILSVLFNGSSSDIMTSDCEEGWFGSNCEFKCHCAYSTCSETGTCTNSTLCIPGWFGPACQFEERVFKFGVNSTHWLLDGDPLTCNDNRTQITVSVSFHTPFRFTWLQMIASSKISLDDFTVTFNMHRLPCINQKTHGITSTEVYVTCELLEHVFQIAVGGVVVKDLCNLGVNGGRNVALRQPSNQSTTIYNSSLAIDGQLEKLTSQNEFCSQTTQLDTSPIYYLYFRQPATLYKTKIYIKPGFRFFVLKTYSSTGQLVHKYIEHTTSSLYTHTFSETNETISWLTISVQGRLAICEIVIFGDISCPVGKWGLDCSHACHCSVKSICFGVTGSCFSGCSPHYYGSQCDLACPDGCSNKVCNGDTGNCIECVSGFYGSNCSFPCSSACLNNSCNSLNGSCYSCPEGRYGEKCSMKCPTSCKEQICNTKNGYCSSCKNGFYGDICSLSCPNNCQNQICVFGNGTCFACKAGYHGASCTNACSSSCFNKTCDITSGSCTQIAESRSETSTYNSMFIAIGLVFCCAVIALAVCKSSSSPDAESGHRKHGKSNKNKHRRQRNSNNAIETK